MLQNVLAAEQGLETAAARRWTHKGTELSGSKTTCGSVETAANDNTRSEGGKSNELDSAIFSSKAAKKPAETSKALKQARQDRRRRNVSDPANIN